MTRGNSAWYAEGLRFACTECGGCCTGGTGYVWVTPQEMQALADHLKLPFDTFTLRYVRQVDDHFALIEKAGTGDCVFLKDKRCTVYPARPSQCRSFPFWPRLLASSSTWKKAAERCEGINDSAPVVPLPEILKISCQTPEPGCM